MNITTRRILERTESLLNEYPNTVGGVIVVLGLLWRVWYVSDLYLSPDEALHYLVAAQDDLASHGLHGWTRIAHPPLFTLILHAMLHLGRSESVLRAVPIAAGALFPWFVSIWVRRFTSHAAALCAQLFLTFSPALIALSSEVRAYTAAFLFLSIALVFLEKALDAAKPIYMVWFHVFLYLAILTEYCVIWFVVAAGLYALARLWNSHGVGRAATWVCGQVGALGLYAFLFVEHIVKAQKGLIGDLANTWLQGAFLQSDQHLLTFVVTGSLKQFKYILGNRWLAPVGASAFMFGSYRLWKTQGPLRAMFVIVPFCLGCLGGILHLFPYGSTRHTAVLGIAMAVAFGCAAAALTRDRLLPIVVAAAVAIPVCAWVAEGSSLEIPKYRHSLSQMHDAIRFLRFGAPAGSLIVTDGGTYMMLAYYLGSRDGLLFTQSYDAHESLGLRLVVAPPFQFPGETDLREAVSQTQRRYPSGGPVWVAAGGYGISVPNPASSVGAFEKAIAIFDSRDLPDATPVVPASGSGKGN